MDSGRAGNIARWDVYSPPVCFWAPRRFSTNHAEVIHARQAGVVVSAGEIGLGEWCNRSRFDYINMWGNII